MRSQWPLADKVQSISQQQLSGPIPPYHPNKTTGYPSGAFICSGPIWDSVNASWNICALEVFPVIPVVIALIVLLCLFFSLACKWSGPIWLVNFVSESRLEKPAESSRHRSWRSFWRLDIALILVSVAGLVEAVFLLALDPKLRGIDGLYLALFPFPWGIAILYIAIRPVRTASALLCLLYVSIIFVDVSISEYRSRWLVGAVTAAIAVVIILLMPLRPPHLSSEGVSKPYTTPTSELRSPEDNMSTWQWMSVLWMSPMIKIGKTRQMHFEDVWTLPYDFQHSRLHEAFRVLKGSVIKRLLLANGLDLIINSFLGVIEVLCDFARPVLLALLLRTMQNPDAPRRAAVIYAVLSLVAHIVAAQSHVFSLWYSRRAYERSRGEMITMLYEKTLARKIIGEAMTEGEDGEPQQSASTGKILNIMRADAYEVAQRFWDWVDIVTTPLGLAIAIVLVVNLMGPESLLGASAVIIAIIINAFVVKILLSWERTRRAATDEKLKIITQFIEAIRHLRYNSWEGKWLDEILTARQRELKLRVKTALLNIVINLTDRLASDLFPILAFLAYTVLSGKPLSVDIAFPALQLIGMLDDYLRRIPDLVQTYLNAWIAIGRIEAFMREPNRIKIDDDVDALLASPETIRIAHASFAWPGKPEAVLKDVTLEIDPGLAVVYGKVGAGKTAFLQALLGEVDLLSGSYTQPNAMIAYCGQTPWLQNMSIRDNILFGSPFEVDRYKRVLTACALTTDLVSFKNGDLSFIGENGIGLSGGQKARVALARAIYSRAPYLFLDDPISALDQQTAEHIMQQCIAGPLCKDRAVVLVTHRLDLVENLATQAIEICDGRASLSDVESLHTADGREASGGAHANGHAETGRGDDNDTTDKADEAVKDKFVDEEKRAHGGVKLHVYWEYIKAGKLKWWLLVVFVSILFRLFFVAESWFLKAWGESYDRIAIALSTSDPFKRLPPPDVNIKPWLVGFTLIAFGQAITQCLSNITMIIIVYVTGKRMFHDTLQRVSTAAFRFYDVTPVGRLMNRMTSDIGVLDGNISSQLRSMFWNFTAWASSVVVIASVTPTFLVFSIVIIILFVYLFTQFLPTSQNLRRLEMVSLSPLMANFGTLIEGLATVRAFRAQRRFQDGVIKVVDTFQKMDHFYWSLQAWLMIRSESLSAFGILVLTLLAIYTNVSPGLTAFALVAAGGFISATHHLCREYGQLELDFTSVERVVELLHVEQEPQPEKQPPAAWPTSGALTFDDVSIRYAPHLDLVLKDISLEIPSGSNVAVVGRTGSGKSTLALALLAAVRPESGNIYLDGVDICSIKPADLRRRITFLAQEPTLFVGSMRQNLDPLDEYGDAECSGVLERLLCAARYGWTLDTRVEAGGRNLSQGQRQLVQLARAILRRSPLVVLDEATASIDLGTSIEVQDILRQEMRASTVVTIAHRVEAVANADWCVQLAHGRVVAQGRPGQLERVQFAEDDGQGVEDGAVNGSSDRR